MSSISIVEVVNKWVNNIHENIVQHGQESVHYTPHLKMVFEYEEMVYEFYNEYSRIGFGIRREYGNKNKIDRILTSRRFTCSKRANEVLTNETT